MANGQAFLIPIAPGSAGVFADVRRLAKPPAKPGAIGKKFCLNDLAVQAQFVPQFGRQV
jgi:hypothetical protein